MKKLLHKLFSLHNSVLFGIALMVGIALYIAVGSGKPQVREFFEMTDLEFFNAWPLKLMMLLLVTNLTLVTFKRIPFTPPRYGVWCIHTGIVLLIAGMSKYYWLKSEGLIMIPIGQTVDHYYDASERSLYVKLDKELWSIHPLQSLPRFAAYASEMQNDSTLNRRDLRGIVPRIANANTSLAKYLHLPGDLKIDVTGYWPWANIVTQYVEDPKSDLTGIKLSLEDTHHGQGGEMWLIGSDSAGRAATFEGAEIEHRLAEAHSLAIYQQAAQRVHRINMKLGEAAQTLFVEPGQSYDLGDTGYRITVETYNPAWPLFGTNQMVKALTLMVKTPATEFRRMILEGKDLQTDFQLNVEGAGPMGKRLQEPIDKKLVLLYSFDDPFSLSPREGTVKHTLLTGDDGAIIDLSLSTTSSTQISTFADGNGQIEISGGPVGPFMAKMGMENHPTKLSIHRSDHVRKDQTVQIIPPALRKRNEEGGRQVIRVKISTGDWQRTILVPFVQEAAEPWIPWDSSTIALPGTDHTIRLALGNTRLALPARITLKQFELEPYPGGDKAAGSIMRDFRSTLEIENLETGEKSVDVAHMNNPVYFDGGRWLFYQNAYDGERQQFTILGIGNRPAMRVMTCGCVLMGFGLLYAFYVKPVIIRRMRQTALATAAGKKAEAEVAA